MYYSKTIWELFYNERKTAKEIVEMLDVPLCNETFVSIVIRNNSHLRRMPKHHRISKHRRPKFHKKLRSEITYRQQAGLHRRKRKREKNLW